MNRQSRNRTIIAILIAVVWILAIVTIALVINFLKPSDNVNLANTNNTKISELIKGDDRKRLQKYLVTEVEAIRQPNSGSSNIDFTIRESSIEISENEDGSTKLDFLIDIDALKYTYAVKMTLEPKESVYEDIYFTCPSIAQMKYKDTFCIGDLETSTISVLFGSNFQYNGLIEDIEYSAYASIDRNNNPEIAFYSRACEEDAADKILSDFKLHYKSLDYNLDLIPYDLSDIQCVDME